jgi:hypothetical protein
MSVGFPPASDRQQRPPREVLFEFYMNHRFLRAEPLDRGKWGVKRYDVISLPARDRRSEGPSVRKMDCGTKRRRSTGIRGVKVIGFPL